MPHVDCDVPSLDRFSRLILPDILSAVEPARAVGMAGSIVENDRWNSFDRWHETSRRLTAAYLACGASADFYPIGTGGVRGNGKWVIPEAANIVDATLDLVHPIEKRLLDYRRCPWHVVQWSAATPPEGITAALAVVDSAEQLASDLSGSLQGKIVLTRLNPILHRAGFCAAGVAGLLFDIPVPDCPGAVAWTKFGWGGLDLYEGATPLPGFAISAIEGDALRALCRQGTRLIVHAKLDIRRYAGAHDVVSGVIQGREDPDSEIWAVAHSAEPGALDNASGSAACVEIARTLTGLIQRGRLPQPRRTIRLLHGYECYGFFHYLEHAFRLQPPLAGVCIDTIGARPDICGGECAWHATAPASASFVDGIGLALLRATLAARPVYQLRRKPFLSTEDTLLGDPKYGFPCPWITNHPCRGYHSSADTMDMIDEQGMAVCTAAMAGYLYYLADASTAEALELAQWHTRQTIARMQDEDAKTFEPLRESLRQQHRSTIDRLQRFTLTGDHATPSRGFDQFVDAVAEAAGDGCSSLPLPVLRERAGVRVLSSEESARPSRQLSAAAAGVPEDGENARSPERGAAPAGDPTFRPASTEDSPELLIPLRRLPLAPTPENVWPHTRRKLDPSFPKWAAYWADGQRSLAEIAALVSLDADHELPLPRVIDYFQALAELGYVDLYRRDDFLTAYRIAADLSALGVQPGMDLFVHSSMKSIGPVLGGPSTIIDALLSVLGPHGTLLAPTFNHHHARIFNPLLTPTTDGAIPDALWRRPDARRSLHPSHSVAAIGPRADDYLRDHLTNGVWSETSPIGRLIRNGGSILSIGVGHDRTTAYHVAEISLNVPCLDPFGSTDRILDPEGRVRTVPGLAWRNAECPVDPAGIDAMLEGKQSVGKVGRARATLARAIDVFEARRQQLGDRCSRCPIRPERRNVAGSDKIHP
jgi:aminoglycoside N3'-acetyltransferase